MGYRTYQITNRDLASYKGYDIVKRTELESTNYQTTRRDVKYHASNGDYNIEAGSLKATHAVIDLYTYLEDDACDRILRADSREETDAIYDEAKKRIKEWVGAPDSYKRWSRIHLQNTRQWKIDFLEGREVRV